MYECNPLEFENFESSDERMRKSHSARCGHVKRRILAEERLKGKTLDFALDVLASQTGFSDPSFLQGIAESLKKGVPLDEYEKHIMVDVILVHCKIAGGL